MMSTDDRIATLKQFANKEGVPLPDDVADYIASYYFGSDKRELEGALIRVIAYASLTDQNISVPLAVNVLNSITTTDHVH